MQTLKNRVKALKPEGISKALEVINEELKGIRRIQAIAIALEEIRFYGVQTFEFLQPMFPDHDEAMQLVAVATYPEPYWLIKALLNPDEYLSAVKWLDLDMNGRTGLVSQLDSDGSLIDAFIRSLPTVSLKATALALFAKDDETLGELLSRIGDLDLTAELASCAEPTLAASIVRLSVRPTQYFDLAMKMYGDPPSIIRFIGHLGLNAEETRKLLRQLPGDAKHNQALLSLFSGEIAEELVE